MLERPDPTVTILVEMVTLLLGEDPKFDRARLALFDVARENGHIQSSGFSTFAGDQRMGER